MHLHLTLCTPDAVHCKIPRCAQELDHSLANRPAEHHAALAKGTMSTCALMPPRLPTTCRVISVPRLPLSVVNISRPSPQPPSPQAEQRILARNENKEYLSIEGLDTFRAATVKLLLGDSHPAVKEGRVACIQSLSGTGSLRVASAFIARCVVLRCWCSAVARHQSCCAPPVLLHATSPVARHPCYYLRCSVTVTDAVFSSSRCMPTALCMDVL